MKKFIILALVLLFHANIAGSEEITYALPTSVLDTLNTIQNNNSNGDISSIIDYDNTKTNTDIEEVDEGNTIKLDISSIKLFVPKLHINNSFIQKESNKIKSEDYKSHDKNEQFLTEINCKQLNSTHIQSENLLRSEVDNKGEYEINPNLLNGHILKSENQQDIIILNKNPNSTSDNSKTDLFSSKIAYKKLNLTKVFWF